MSDSDWIQFCVLGRPRPAGSKRAMPVKMKDGSTRTIIVDANPASKPWKQEVAQTARSIYRGPLLEGPIVLMCHFQFARPKSHYRTGKNSHMLRDSAPVYHTQKPDVTKLVRAVEDALIGVIYRDDCRVTDQVNSKDWGEMDCTIIRLTTQRNVDVGMFVDNGSLISHATTAAFPPF